MSLVNILAIMEALKGLSSKTIEPILLQVQDHRRLWDKAQSGYKGHNLKEKTWNSIR